MKCCAKCIGDRHLASQIIPHYSDSVGTCSYCGALEQKLVDPVKLKEKFELVADIYLENDEGDKLVDLLKNDWGLLSDPNLSNEKALSLLSNILEDSEINKKLYVPSPLCRTETLLQWERFRKELKHQNRFFPKYNIDEDKLKIYLDLLAEDSKNMPSRMYRSRISKNGEVFTLDQMGAPPEQKSTHGRANPAGIPYLYLASDVQTAISEIRPHTGETVYVAEFILPDDLKLIDLRNPKKTVSPFVYEDEVSSLYGDIEFLERLGDELTLPVLPSAAAIDYVPSQYLCEFIKACDIYKGVIYRSSVGTGLNIAIFNPESVSKVTVSKYYVEKVTVESKNTD